MNKRLSTVCLGVLLAMAGACGPEPECCAPPPGYEAELNEDGCWPYCEGEAPGGSSGLASAISGDWTGISRQWHNGIELLDTRSDNVRVRVSGSTATLTGICGGQVLHLAGVDYAAKSSEQLVCPTRFTNGCFEISSHLSGTEVRYDPESDSLNVSWILHLSGCGFWVETRVFFDSTERINASIDV